MTINHLTITDAAELLAKKKISSVELTKIYLKRIKKIDTQLHAYITVTEEVALAQAKEADKKIKSGKNISPLCGIPASVKDIIMTKNIKSTACSNILADYMPAFDATIIERLKSQGLVILGKVNCDAFAHGASTENSDFGPTHNPFDLERVPGGSSGGSAASVAANECVYSLGTDTGGSIRQPAAFCGVVGLKPTYGRISRYGLISMTSSTDCPGPIAKTVKDAALILQAIAGQDSYDATTSSMSVPDYSKNLGKNIKKLKIGIPKEYFLPTGVDKKVKATIDEAIKKFKELGAEIIDITLPYTRYAVPVYYIITPSEVSSNLERYDGIKYGFSVANANGRESKRMAANLYEVYSKSRGLGFGAEAKRRIMIGTYALSAGFYDAYYKQAALVRAKIKNDFDDAFTKVDVILTPTAPDTAFKLGEKNNDPLKMYLEDIYVTAASLAGLPAISLPCGIVNNLPVGLQLISKAFDEETILRAAYNYETATDWRTQLIPNLKV